MSTLATQVELGSICTFIGGGTPSRDNPEFFKGDIPWVTVKDFIGDTILDTQEHITEAAVRSSATKIADARSILLVSRVGLGKVALAGRALAINQDIKAIVPSACMLPEFCFWFLRSNAQKIIDMGAGSTVKGITLDQIRRLKVPLPPLDEQQRIVDILDRAASIQRLRQAADEKLKEIIPALFVDMFGDPATNPKGWPTDKLGSYIEEFRYGTSQKSGPTGLPVLRIPNVIADTLDTGEIKLVELNEAEQRRLMLRDGDVLFVRTNGNPDYVGRSAVFNRTALDQAGFDGSKCVYASYLIRARLNAELCPHFLQAYLTTAEGRKFLRERSKTSAGQYNINIDGLSSVPVYVPPIELQNQFREKLDALRSTGSLAGKASVAAQLIAASLSAQLCSP